MTPVGELVRYVVLSRLVEGSATIEEIEMLVKTAIEKTGKKFDWRVWPWLVTNEITISNNVVALSERGRFLVAVGLKAMGDCVRKCLGIDPDTIRGGK